jgi:ribonuclease VapC
MVIDTSAIAAIFFSEPDAAELRECIADDPIRLISAATIVEAGMVIEARFGEAGRTELDLWLHNTDMEVVTVSAEHADQARRAWRKYG